MHKLKIFFAGCFIYLFPLNISAQQFTVSGGVEGLPEGAWIYLRKTTPQIVLDSAQVTQGRFTLKGSMAEKAVLAFLHTARFENYVTFWLEPKPITVNLKKGEFKKAAFSGSAAQLEDEKMRSIINPLMNREDSLMNLLSSTKNEAEKQLIRKQIKMLNEEEKNIYVSFVNTHPNSIVAAHILKVYASSWGKEKTSALYEQFSPEIKKSELGIAIHEYISLSQEIKVGGKYVDFEQENTLGKPVKLSAIKAKYILLEFWGSWCGPCRAENPNLVKTYNTYHPKGFEILGVAADDNKAQWLKAVKDDKLPWENVCDLRGDQNRAALIYGINAYPTNFLIDENGIIIAKNLRGDDLRKKLAELLP